MKTLLIHNNNLNWKVIYSFENNYPFDITKQALLRKGFNFDQHICEKLKECFSSDNEYELIVIPASLTIDNYIEFTGLRFALHIRLSKECRHSRTPILIISTESPAQIGKISPLANIFLTSGVFHTTKQSEKEVISEIEKLKSLGISQISDNAYKDFLDKIRVDPPPNFDSKHSIDNEYAIHSWSKYIGISNNQIEAEIETSLHFKYLNASRIRLNLGDTDNTSNEEEEDNVDKIDEPAEIFLIDDQAEKGWQAFYEKMLDENKKLTVPDIDYNKDKEDLKRQVMKEIEEKEPDVVIMDLRLHDDDFQIQSGLSGVQIISELENNKDFNKGIRFIIVSASDKIWNYLDANIKDSDLIEGIITKNGQSNSVSQKVEKIEDTINESIIKAKYLKGIYSTIKKIRKYLNKNFPNSHITSDDSFDVSFKLVRIGLTQKKYLNFAFIELYRVIERFIKQDEVSKVEKKQLLIQSDSKYLIAGIENEKAYGKFESLVGYSDKKFKKEPSNIEKRNSGEFDTDPLFRLILFFGYGIDTEGKLIKKWGSLNWIRNKVAVHGSKVDNGVVKKEHIKDLLEIIYFIVNPENRNDKNKKYEKIPDNTESLKTTDISMTYKGTVKFFNNDKGFGFIKPTDESGDIFVHANGLIGEIREDDKVEYEVEQGRKGLNAVNVKVIV